MANDIFTEANAEAIEAAENVNVPATEEQNKDHTGLIIGIAGATIAGGYIIHRIRKNRRNAADAAKYQELTKAMKEQHIEVIEAEFEEPPVEEPKKEAPKHKGNKSGKKKKKK